jgi:phosphoenolpyruvate carboxykinase (ATP)
MLDASLRGDLHSSGIECVEHPVFHLKVPKHCPDVDATILDARAAWTDKADYDAKAEELRNMFRENFAKNDFERFGVEPVL